MADIQLTMGFHDYDHVRDLATGRVKPEGIELTSLQMEVEEIFPRFGRHQEWDVSEMSFGGFCSAVAAGDAPFVGIPVFPSRVFRHSSIYVRADAGITKPEDLAGKRVGVPGWSQTATIYVRGWLADDIGVPLRDIEWFQGGANEAGRVDFARFTIPAGVRYTPVTDRSLQEMLLAGDLDAMFTARPPRAFEAGDPRVVQLYPDYRPVEEAYFAETGIFPIMHVVAIRREIFERHRWVALNLFQAFEEAKRRSVVRLKKLNASQIAIPWGPLVVGEIAEKMFPDGDYWPYGIEPNRPTIEAFLKYCFDQGVTSRHLAPEEIFAPEALTVIRD